MKKDPDVFVKHMIDAIDRIERYIEGMDREAFLADDKTIDAVIRQFEILGEAAGRFPSELVGDSPIPWHSITGLRHRLIHQYFGVDVDVVWKTASEELLPLKKYLEKK